MSNLSSLVEVSHKLVASVATEILQLTESVPAFSLLRIHEVPQYMQKLQYRRQHPEKRVLSTTRGDRVLDVLSAVQWAEGVWRAWFLALTMRREPDHVLEDDPAGPIMRKLALKYLVNEKLAVKYVKEQTTWLTARALGQLDEELPIVHGSDGKSEIPLNERGVFGGGWVYRRCRAMSRNALREGQSFAERRKRIGEVLDLLMSKLGRPPVSEELVQGTLDGYRTDMTDIGSRFATSTSENLRERAVLRQRLKDRIREICHFMFQGRTFQARDCIPSLNASFETSRRWGGNCGGLMESWAARTFGEEIPQETNETVVKVPIHDGGVERVVKVPVKGLDYVQSFQEFVDEQALRTVEKGLIDVSPFPIVEPDKVRVITMEEEAISYRCLEIQKFLHGVVKSYPPFTYIGKPLDGEGWTQHFGVNPLKDDELYQSGDYEGATNNINPILSECVWDAICSEVNAPPGPLDADVAGSGSLLSTIWWKVGRMDLTGHLFHFKGLEPARQVWGQLMGSPTSFPVLCIVNLAASSLGVGMTVEEIFDPHCPILINGDDLATVCSRRRYPIWSRYVSAAGLKPSLGKNYMSPYFLIMNSECRIVRLVEDKPTWELVGFLNQALLRGFEKKGIEAGKDLKPEMGWWQLGARARELVEGIPPVVAKRWLDMFVFEHRNVLSLVPPGVSWTASEALGGVGLPDPENREIPKDNLKLHTFIACLSEEQRRTLLSYPRRETKSWFDQALADSEKHYARYLPSHYEERDRMDLVLENWGFPVTREKSDLGSILRLAFVLDRFILQWKDMSPQARLACELKEVGRNREANGCLELGKAGEDATFQKKFARLRYRLMHAADHAKGAVLDWEEVREGDPKGMLHLMSQAKARVWTPPVELIIDWTDIITLEPIRFGVGNHRCGRRSRRQFIVDSPLTMQARLCATRLGSGLFQQPQDGCCGSWEREDYEREDVQITPISGDPSPPLRQSMATPLVQFESLIWLAAMQRSMRFDAAMIC